MRVISASINRWGWSNKPTGSVKFALEGDVEVSFPMPEGLINIFETLAIEEYKKTLRKNLEVAMDKPALTYTQEQAAKALSAPPAEDVDFEPANPGDKVGF
jgi:hypothetical protein